MTSRPKQLHVCFFPFPAPGHMLPTVDMAKLFASRGCKATLILTRGNAPSFSSSIQRSRDQLGLDIQTVLVDFPAAEVGLPEGFENANQMTKPEMTGKFFAGAALLERPLERVLTELRPDCLVAAAFFPWATAVAATLGIPRLVFHGTCFFALCVASSLMEYKPHEKAGDDLEPFLVPNLPHEIRFVRDQLPAHVKDESDWSSFSRRIEESEMTSHGVVVNSFHELEPEYSDHYRTFLGRKAWNVGPVSLLNKDTEDKAQRGLESSMSCLKWLDSKKPNSVVYVSFGSIANFGDAQLREIAAGLEASGKDFIWVVKRKKEERENWLPEGFEERVEGRGVVVRGWAPQVAVLDHVAVGGFVTHCGWNSVAEGLCAGVPMVTWPVASEQFYNEKLVTEVLRIGVAVGARKWARFDGDSVGSGAVERALRRITEGEEAQSMRARAQTLAQKARTAFGEGGSSHSDLGSLIQELILLRS